MMTVGELIALLQREDPQARVGVTLTSLHGWVSDVVAVKHDEHGVVCLDQSEESAYADEVKIA